MKLKIFKKIRRKNMKTLEKSKNTENVYVYTEKELKTKINKTLEKIETWVRIMDYRLTDDINIYKNMNILTYNLSKNQLKKINKYLNGVNKKMTLRNVNSLLHLLYKTFEPIKKIQVKKSEKEEEIQKKRKEWLKLRDKAEKALLEYKNEKGDYYKERMKRQELFTF